MQVHWKTIRALARTKGLEVIINFPFGMAINRLLLTSGEIPQKWQERLDATFGSDEWRELAYEVRTDLFGDVSTSKRPDTRDRILHWFKERLRSAYGFASSPQLISNTRGNPLYYLIWAGPHEAGLKGANYILGPALVDPKTTSRFALAQTLNHYRVANPPIQFHSLHPPPFAPKCKGLSLTEFCSGATRLSGRFSEGLLLRRSHMRPPAHPDRLRRPAFGRGPGAVPGAGKRGAPRGAGTQPRVSGVGRAGRSLSAHPV